MNQNTFDDDETVSDSAPLKQADRDRLRHVQDSLAWGRGAREWWEHDTGNASEPALGYGAVNKILKSEVFDKAFLLMRQSEESDHDFSYGFYRRTSFGGRPERLVGVVQQMFFDQPKFLTKAASKGARQGEIERWRQNLHDFVFKYFMKVSDWRRPMPHFGEGQRRLAPYLQPVSMCPKELNESTGFSWARVYYKRQDGRIAKVRQPDEHALVDLERLYEDYEWIVFRLGMEDFKLNFQPLPDLPFVTVPMVQVNYVVVDPEMVIREEEQRNGLLARYGFGCARLKDPAVGDALSYGPAKFDGAFSQFDFSLLEGGAILARVVYVVRQPETTFNLPLNPADWGLELATRLSPEPLRRPVELLSSPWRSLARRLPFGSGFDPFLTFIRLANTVTAGQAARQLCISREQVEKLMMIETLTTHRDMLLGAQHRWRRVRDWTDEKNLPKWVRG